MSDASNKDEKELQRRVGLLERALDQRKQQIKQLRLLAQRSHRWSYGSITPPVADWDARWQTQKNRVLYFATRDYSGSMFNFSAAVNRDTDWAARLVVVHPHQYGYPNDIVYGAPTLLPPELDQLVQEADVVHIKDEAGFLDGSNLMSQDLFRGKPRVAHLYGGVARRLQDDRSFREHVNGHDATVAVTPDLCFDWLRSPRYIPHTVDVAATPYAWHDSRLVGHSPSRRERKGTEEFLTAVQRIPDIEVDLIEGASNEECLRRKERVSLFFDQAGFDNLADGREIGWYGNSGLEALARGIPTLAHLSEDAYAGAARGGHDITESCPVIESGTTANSIQSAMEVILSSSAEHRAELSRRTRQWVKDFHDYPVVATQMTSLYDQIR